VPPDLIPTLLALADQLYDGTEVKRDGKQVVVSLKRPDQLGTAPEADLIASAGFNDAEGMNANRIPGSPYRLKATARAGGAGEPGWLGPWPPSLNAVYQSKVVKEGDGAMKMTGPASLTRQLREPQKGSFEVEQWVRLPEGGQITASLYRHGPGARGREGDFTGPMWGAAADGKFVVFQGDWGGTAKPVETKLKCQPDKWYKVTLRVDVRKATWEFSVDGTSYKAEGGALRFRTKQEALDTVRLQAERPAGFYLDALRLTRVGPAPAAGEED
jgi:hypothetical protein